jgi:hypothetical protein
MGSRLSRSLFINSVLCFYFYLKTDKYQTHKKKPLKSTICNVLILIIKIFLSNHMLFLCVEFQDKPLRKSPAQIRLAPIRPAGEIAA